MDKWLSSMKNLNSKNACSMGVAGANAPCLQPTRAVGANDNSHCKSHLVVQG